MPTVPSVPEVIRAAWDGMRPRYETSWEHYTLNVEEAADHDGWDVRLTYIRQGGHPIQRVQDRLDGRVGRYVQHRQDYLPVVRFVSALVHQIQDAQERQADQRAIDNHLNQGLQELRALVDAGLDQTTQRGQLGRQDQAAQNAQAAAVGRLPQMMAQRHEQLRANEAVPSKPKPYDGPRRTRFERILDEAA